MQIVCWANDYLVYAAGDVCAILPDGVELGRDVEPATAPDTCPYVILQVSGSSKARLLYLRKRLIDPLVPWRFEPRPGHPDGDLRRPNVIGPRQYRFDPQRLSAGLRSQWGARARLSLSSEAAFEAAIRDRADSDRPVDRARLPRQ